MIVQHIFIKCVKYFETGNAFRRIPSFNFVFNFYLLYFLQIHQFRLCQYMCLLLELNM